MGVNHRLFRQLYEDTFAGRYDVGPADGDSIAERDRIGLERREKFYQDLEACFDHIRRMPEGYREQIKLTVREACYRPPLNVSSEPRHVLMTYRRIARLIEEAVDVTKEEKRDVSEGLERRIEGEQKLFDEG